MTERSLQVTYRKGRAFAAYLHLAASQPAKRAHGWCPRPMAFSLSITEPPVALSVLRSPLRRPSPLNDSMSC